MGAVSRDLPDVVDGQVTVLGRASPRPGDIFLHRTAVCRPQGSDAMSMHRRALMIGIAVALMLGGWASAAAESSDAKTDKASRGGRKEAKARADESPTWDEAESKDRGAGRRGRAGDRRAGGRDEQVHPEVARLVRVPAVEFDDVRVVEHGQAHT